MRERRDNARAGKSKRQSRGNHRSPLDLGVFALALGSAALLWPVFVAGFNPHEMIVGAFCVLLTMVFTYFVARTLDLKLKMRLQDLAQAWRLPWYELTGNATIVLVLLKDLLGIAPAQNCFRVCGFDSSRHDPVRASRTVMAIAFTSAAPNCIVLGIEPSLSRMLFHQVSPTGVQGMAKSLGAKG